MWALPKICIKAQDKSKVHHSKFAKNNTHNTITSKDFHFPWWKRNCINEMNVVMLLSAAKTVQCQENNKIMKNQRGHGRRQSTRSQRRLVLLRCLLALWIIASEHFFIPIRPHLRPLTTQGKRMYSANFPPTLASGWGTWMIHAMLC